MSAASLERGDRPPSSVRRVVVASLVGTSLEWYDFFIYGTAAALVFNTLFFPSFDPLVGTLLAFATYAVGFVARPLSGVLVLVGLWIRMTVAESPAFQQVETKQEKARAPIVDVLRRYPRQVLLAVGARVGVDVAFYIFVLFITTYVVTYLRLPSHYALNAVLLAAAIQVVFIPFFGSLTDRVGRRPVYIAGAIGAVVWSFVFFALLDSGSFPLIVIAAVVALIAHAAMYGPQASFIAEMFPTKVRYSGASMGYQLAGIVGGALAPIIATALLDSYDTSLAISIYAAAVLLLTLVCVAIARETANADLQADGATLRAWCGGSP